ncbi:FCD domain-containing protein [Streptomyces sp. NBC_00287]|uniref:FCD domain-containing protein n=1 Tax=Streptomyces sp. NBC_00287 TaxID=2975702 RepID=UPI003FA759D7
MERETVHLAAATWDRSASAAFTRHVGAERDATDQQNHRLCGRLAAEFHIKLGEHCGNPLMERYLSEVVWRCALILVVHGHPHDQSESVAEYQELIALLDAGEADAAEQLVLRHIGAVESRALARTPEVAPPDLAAILSRY